MLSIGGVKGMGTGQVNRLSNNRVNASVRPVTPLASASGAPVRPARYAGRWADKNKT